MPLILLPANVAARIIGWDSSWGWLDLSDDPNEDLIVVAGSSRKQEVKLPDTSNFRGTHYLRRDPVTNGGVWYRVDPELHDVHTIAMAKRGAVAPEFVQGYVAQGWRVPPADRFLPVVAMSTSGDDVRWSAWWINRDQAIPAALHVIAGGDPLEMLRETWPIDDLSNAQVTLVGAGSIGGAAAHALASYGIRHITVLDPDHLLEHNLVRHRLTQVDLGRYKVNAIADQLRRDHPGVSVTPLPLDVITDADVVRTVLDQSAVVLCTSDGVASRRVVNHLARRADIPAVFACVLEDGALGEIVSVRADTGCLGCCRLHLQGAGSIDPEPSLDQGYGTGNSHRPMTAVPGDLSLVADVAAKATVAFLLEAKGHADQVLPGSHVLIGLRPIPGLAPPFDIERAGDVRWRPIGSRHPECFTCADQ